jgi:fatty acid desaturase
VWGWIGNGVFAITAIPAAFAGSDALEIVAIVTALVLFVIGVGTCLYAFGKGLARSTEGDNVAVSNLFFLQGSAPAPVKRRFLWMFLVCLAITAVSASGLNGFPVLVPMLPVGLAGTWAARHGVFPPRPPAAPRRR